MAPRRATARGVRLLLRRCPRSGARPHAARHARRDERRAPRAVGGDGLRGARRRGPRDRGRQLHRLSRPDAAPRDRPVPRHRAGPGAVYFYNLFQSERTGAPSRPEACGRHHRRLRRGRRPVARDARRLRLLLFYLSDYDYASHAAGPDAASAVLARCDEAVGGLVRAAGGLDAFVERYAVVVMSDHGQSSVREVARLGDRFRHAEETLVAASNRAGHVSARPVGSDRPRAGRAARRRPVRRGGSLPRGRRRRRAPRGRGDTHRGDARRARARGRRVAPRPARRRPRAVAAVRCPNAGEVLVSARDGWEFHDLGGGHHLGGGSHGSLTAADSLVPVLTVGLEAPAPRSMWTSRRSSSTTSAWRHRPTSCVGRHDRRVGRSCRGAAVADGRRPAAAPWREDERVLAAMERVPREAFVPPVLASHAYDDAALSIGEGQTISQPYIVAAMCSLLALEGSERVLDVGTGSGYGAAVLDSSRQAWSRSSGSRSSPVPPAPRWTSRVTGRSRCGSAMGGSERPTGRRSTRCRRGRDRARPAGALRAARRRRPPRAAARGLARTAARPRRPHRGGRRRDGLARLPLRAARRRLAGRTARARAGVRATLARAMDHRRCRRPTRHPGAGSTPRSVGARTGSSSSSSASSARRGTSSTSPSTPCCSACSTSIRARGGRLVLVAVTNNYRWNRLWTFRGQRGHVVHQGLRFFVVSSLALGANLVVLHLWSRRASGSSSPRRSRSSSSPPSTSSATSSGRSVTGGDPGRRGVRRLNAAAATAALLSPWPSRRRAGPRRGRTTPARKREPRARRRPG